MNRRLAGLVAALSTLACPALASAADTWQPLSRTALAARGAAAKVETAPDRFKAFALDRPTLKQALNDDVISIPDPTGTLVRFRVEDDPVLAPALAAQHPEIRTYSAVGIDDPSQTARLDLTPLGFHAAVRGDGGAWYVDPYYKDSQSAYVAYSADQLPDVHGPFSEPDLEETAAAVPQTARRAGELVKQRTYRLALISDPTYATYFGSANVLAAKTVLVNRTNQLYNDDLGIKLVLIDQTPKLNLDTDAKYHQIGLFGGACGLATACYPPVADPTGIDPTNPTASQNVGDACGTVTIATNGTVLSQLLTGGNADYDIGHLALGRPGGGVAGLGVVGNDTSKARGCTGVPTPKGDFYAVDYFSHEVGHQFGGNHTFGGTQFNCAGSNRNDATSVEPGSGSSVMAYAGICRQDNLQPHSDPYFSQRSIDEIQAYVTGGTAGAANQGNVVTTTTNHAPVVTAAPDVAIPPRTPFTLTGSATDQDAGAQLVYLWEQNDTKAADGNALVSNDKPSGALFRVFGRYANVTEENKLLSPSPGENTASSADATRTFPDPAQIAAGNTNAASGKCPDVTLASDDDPAPPPVAIDTVECYSEFLPTSARELHFRLTARDRTTDGGGVGHADTKVTVVGTTPFRVTSTQANALPGADVPVTWDVAGTAATPVNATQVRITYSTDGGLTFPTVLAATTPNDGMETVKIPDTATTTARFRVEAVGNSFFDVSHTNLTVAAPVVATVSPTPGPATVTPTVSPVPTATPGTARVRPDLSLTARRPRVSRRRRVEVLVRCRVTAGTEVPARCKGSVRLFAKLGRKTRRIARKSYAVEAGSTRVVTLTIRKDAYKRLRRKKKLVTQIRATANGVKATRKVNLRR